MTIHGYQRRKRILHFCFHTDPNIMLPCVFESFSWTVWFWEKINTRELSASMDAIQGKRLILTSILCSTWQARRFYNPSPGTSDFDKKKYEWASCRYGYNPSPGTYDFDKKKYEWASCRYGCRSIEKQLGRWKRILAFTNGGKMANTISVRMETLIFMFLEQNVFVSKNNHSARRIDQYQGALVNENQTYQKTHEK